MNVDIFSSEESGQGMVEYGLILALVAIAALGALTTLGKSTIQPMYEKVKAIIPEASVGK